MNKFFWGMLIILSICSLASADVIDLYLTDAAGNSEISMGVGSTTQLLIWCTSDVGMLAFDFEIDPTGPGQISPDNGAILAVNRNPEYDYVGPGLTNAIAGVEMAGASDADFLGLGLGNPWASLEFTCLDDGDVTLNLLGVTFFKDGWAEVQPTLHGMTIHQVPEPMTIVLLGLGGLYMRSRRK